MDSKLETKDIEDDSTIDCDGVAYYDEITPNRYRIFEDKLYKINASGGEDIINIKKTSECKIDFLKSMIR